MVQQSRQQLGSQAGICTCFQFHGNKSFTFHPQRNCTDHQVLTCLQPPRTFFSVLASNLHAYGLASFSRIKTFFSQDAMVSSTKTQRTRYTCTESWQVPTCLKQHSNPPPLFYLSFFKFTRKNCFLSRTTIFKAAIFRDISIVNQTDSFRYPESELSSRSFKCEHCLIDIQNYHHKSNQP